MRTILFAAALACGSSAFAAESNTVTFANEQTDGWDGSQGLGGATFVDTLEGTPAPSLHTLFNNFGITFRNDSSPNWTGDYTQQPFQFNVDVNSRQVSFFGQDVTRNLVLELRDYDNVSTGFPYVSVYTTLGQLYSAGTGQQDGWRTMGVSLANPNSATLPAGWGGYGDEDPVTFEPILPADRTFASVLASVDEIALTTLEPGFFYGFADFDVSVDNISLQFGSVPEPTSLLLGLGGVSLLRRRR